MNHNLIFKYFVVIVIALFIVFNFLYNNAEKQAQDIKHCESVNASWRYNSFDKILCIPKKQKGWVYNENN